MGKVRFLFATFALSLFFALPCYAGEISNYESMLNSVSISVNEIGIPTDVKETVNASTTGYIFVGDSRYLGLDMVTGMSNQPNNWLVAKVAKGYNWLDDTAKSQIDSIEASNPQISKWYEIYTLGINDPANMKKYSEWYANRAVGHNVLLLSLNPIEHHSSITNEQVAEFNQTLLSTGLPYIDSFAYLLENGYKTSDGVHYNNDTNRKIYSFVNMKLGSMG